MPHEKILFVIFNLFFHMESLPFWLILRDEREKFLSEFSVSKLLHALIF